ncbi:MAG TPA: D-Ala-D-Ala carboxypeptidase family metallohydrolase [Sphingomonas sp.]|nr:D-Ala-D-Ala carboxypeptidase family metallohydrolase [Sphingomonas sp.]
MTEMLSRHFSRTEFEHSDTAVARGIANVMPEALLPAARAVCERLLEPIRDHFGVPLILNSGYRSRALNRALGSKDSSQHRRAEAADIEMPGGPSNAALAAWIADSGLPFDQLILESYHHGQPRSGWVHISHAFDRPQRGQVLTMTLAPHGAAYTAGLHA